MGNLQDVLSTVFGMAVTFFVPAIVWITLVVGLYDLVRDKIRQIRVAPQRSQRLVQESQRV